MTGDLIEYLRGVKWEPIDEAERSSDDPELECVFVDMRPSTFRAMLGAAADALEDLDNASKHSADDLRARDARIAELEDQLEAAREDAERLDWMAGEARMLSGWRETGRWEMPAIQIASARDRCLPDDLRAAIDAERKEARND